MVGNGEGLANEGLKLQTQYSEERIQVKIF